MDLLMFHDLVLPNDLVHVFRSCSKVFFFFFCFQGFQERWSQGGLLCLRLPLIFLKVHHFILRVVAVLPFLLLLGNRSCSGFGGGLVWVGLTGGNLEILSVISSWVQSDKSTTGSYLALNSCSTAMISRINLLNFRSCTPS